MVAAVMTPEAQGVGQSFPVPAPHDGLNTRENYTKLQPTEARVLQNMLPDEGSCNVRPGHAEHEEVSGATIVPTLMVYKGAAGQDLIAAADGELHDVTTSSTVLTAANYTSDRWSHDNFNNFLFGVNGTDVPWRYNGTAVSATGFTGPTLTTLQTVKQVRNRLWFTITNSADVVYGPIGGVTGALTTFQLSQIGRGGKCVAVNSWSRDAGDGADDFTVFVMDTGQVIVYQGDPATSFSLVGKYDAPKLVEADATVKVGGELVLMTVSGPTPMSAIIAGNAFSPDALMNWGKIAPSWQTDYQRYKANPGFNAYFFNGIVYFNFPTGTATTLQYVYNTRVPAWTTYTNMPVASMADFSGELYFGSYSDGWVYRHATGTDNGSPIVTLARQGPSYPTNGAKSARYMSFRPNIDADGPCEIQFCLDVDFQDGTLGGVYSITGSSSGADWGDDWGSEWGAPTTAKRKWYAIRGNGRAVAPVVRTRSSALSVKWWASDLRAGQGGQL
jgi:hypothetical protein